MTDTKGSEPPAGTDTREAILIESSKLFAMKGYSATSTRDIADAVGVRQPALFHHFGSKAEIMRTLQRADLVETLDIVEAAARLEAPPAVQLYVALLGDVDHMLRGPYDFAGTSTSIVLNDTEFAEGKSWWDEIQLRRTAIIDAGVQSGDFIEIDPAFANRAIEWTIAGVLADISIERPVPAEVSHRLVSLAVRSILADRADVADTRKMAETVGDQLER